MTRLIRSDVCGGDMFFKFQKNFRLLLMTGLLAFGGAGGSDFNIGTAGVRGMSVEKENELGQYFMIVARSQLPIVNDPVLSEYLAGTVGRMAAQAQGVRYPFESFFVEDRSVNAAAFFGGKIMVNTGLIAATDTESEFAGVLAHEMTHITQRHLARSLEIQSDAQTAGILGMIGGLILGVVNPALAMATVTASVNGAQQAGINYTRSNEEEADRIGIDLLYRSGFNPEGMPSLFRKLRAMDNKVNPAFEMLLTHPLSEKRVADAENRSAQMEAASENLRATVLKDVTELNAQVSSLQSVLGQFRDHGLASLEKSAKLLKDADTKLKAGGVPVFRATEQVMPKYPDEPEYENVDHSYNGASEEKSEAAKKDDEALAKLRQMADSISSKKKPETKEADSSNAGSNSNGGMALAALAAQAAALKKGK